MDVSYILDNESEYKTMLIDRQRDPNLIDQIRTIYNRYTRSLHQTQRMKRLKNRVSKMISEKTPKTEITEDDFIDTEIPYRELGFDKQGKIILSRELGGKIKEFDNRTLLLFNEMKALVYTVPNLLHPDVVRHNDESYNSIVTVWDAEERTQKNTINMICLSN